jgi:hypothetical protein
MGGDLAAVTDGRYRRVRVDDKTLDIEVHAPEKDDWVPVSSLSQGTLDLVYLVARLGLGRLVTGDRRPPLIFDDPFVTLDDARAARALTLLKGVASDFQVIYMTTSSRYDEAADAVVVLEGPVSVDTGAAVEGEAGVSPGSVDAAPSDVVPAPIGPRVRGVARPGRAAVMSSSRRARDSAGRSGLALLHGLHLAPRFLEPGRVPHPLDLGPGLLLLFPDVLLERPPELLHRGEPRVRRGIEAVDLLDQALGFLDLVEMGRLPGGQRWIDLDFARNRRIEARLFHFLVQLELGAELAPERGPPSRWRRLDVVKCRLGLAVLLLE